VYIPSVESEDELGGLITLNQGIQMP
jgi:hypothetical protein